MSENLVRDYLGRFWNIGNGLTVFMIVQGIAFITAVGSRDAWVCELYESDGGLIATLLWILTLGVGASLISIKIAEREALLLESISKENNSNIKLTNLADLKKVGMYRAAIISLFALSQIIIFLMPLKGHEFNCDCALKNPATFKVEAEKSGNGKEPLSCSPAVKKQM